MPQPPPPAPHVGGPPLGVPAVDEGPAEKAERSRSVSPLPHLGQFGAAGDAETD